MYLIGFPTRGLSERTRKGGDLFRLTCLSRGQQLPTPPFKTRDWYPPLDVKKTHPPSQRAHLVYNKPTLPYGDFILRPGNPHGSRTEQQTRALAGG